MKNKKSIIFILSMALFILMPEIAIAQQTAKEPFDISFQYVYDVTVYRNANPSLEFVSGDVSQPEEGFVVLVKPEPYNAWATVTGTMRVLSTSFRVWIEAGYKDEKDIFKPIGLLTKGNTTQKYLDITRKNTSRFALFIKSSDMANILPKQSNGHYRAHLRFSLARNINSKWPLEWAQPVAHPCSINTYYIDYNPGCPRFLNAEVETVEFAHEYMASHPKKDYFFNRDEVWQCNGWFFNMSYLKKDIINTQLNDNHYVIFSLWKDEAHTQPLVFSYMKDNLFAGGTCDDKTRMEETLNFIAYPHKGYKDWSLFIPWECIHYWWKEGKTATKDDHTCIGYYTLTLSNDGKTPINCRKFDASGWLSIELAYTEEKPDPTKNCNHIFEYKIGNRSIVSIPLLNGCTRDYYKYSTWEECKKCGKYRSTPDVFQPIGNYCKSHDLKETSRVKKDPFQLIIAHSVLKVTPIEITSTCQNDCCNYKEKKTTYEREITDLPTEPDKCPPHRWVCLPAKKIGETTEQKTVNGENWIYYYDLMEQNSKCNECGLIDPIKQWAEFVKRKKVIPPPPRKPHVHDWYYFSELHRSNGLSTSRTVEIAPYDEDSLNIDMKQPLKMAKWKNGSSHSYISCRPLLRQQWLDVIGADNDYVGIKDDDMCVMNNITYQEAYDYIDKLNEKAREELNLDVIFSLPTADEMRKLLKEKVVKPETGRGQDITSFYVDSIEVYDGKGRLVSYDKLSTAPEGAKVRVMVGKMDANGQVTMVDISSQDLETSFFLKATPQASMVNKGLSIPGRLYRLYYRQCSSCGILQLISEKLFYNMRYHKPIINN